ncbi:neutral zinc metallopeptidase [Nonomuraea sp. NPDC050328]|uniref:neutral zinc metallopeptidase n=1 Tax=Nonomuraea sp. NPDC050328 TaxID=3364361 RepID=UPI0037AF2F45
MLRKSPFLLVGMLLLASCATAPPAASEPAPTPTPTAAPARAAAATAPRQPSPSAPPAFDQARDHNPLNKLSKAKALSCSGTPAVKVRKWDTMKRYLTAVKGCLDRFWKREFARAGLRYTPPGATFVRKAPARFCGLEWGKNAGGMYCDLAGLKEDKRFTVVVRPDDVWPEMRIDLAILTAHEYGHHVQKMSGYMSYIDKAFWQAEKKGRKAADLVNRRSELQTECFAGVALGALYDSMFPSRAPWDDYRAYTARWDQEASWDRSHGLPRTQVTWMERGWKAGTTGACDTWHAKSSAVK